MAYNYYLLNGKNGRGQALNLLINGELKRDFIDISTLDLQTMEIKEKNAKDILQEYNPQIDLTGMFYNASYPHAKTKTKSYATIFDVEETNLKPYINKLRYFADERNYKKEHNQKIKLDESKELEEYIRTILYNILNSPQNNLTNYESLMSAKLKEIIKDRYKYYYNVGTNNYINSKIYLLRNLLSNYTELRNLTLEYILYLQKLNTNIRTRIKKTELWNNEGMHQIPSRYYLENNSIQPEPTYEQMELSDFMDMSPYPKKLNKVKK